MRRFLYYLPGVMGVNSRMLSSRGLISRFTAGGGRLIEHGCSTSVEGPHSIDTPRPIGCIVHPSLRPARYEPSRQRWAQYAGVKFCVGLEDIGLPPAPADLERDTGLAGYPITLGDGNSWRVPLLRRWDNHSLTHVCALPQSIQRRPMGGKGSFVPTVRPEFAELHAIADSIFERFLANATISTDELFTRVAELLAVNYRVGPEEVELLGLLTPESALGCLQLAIDAPGMRRCGEAMARAGICTRQTPRPREEKDFTAETQSPQSSEGKISSSPGSPSVASEEAKTLAAAAAPAEDGGGPG